jgi:ATP-dependent helicase HepA
VLVLAPDHLRQQWAAELLDRFRTDEYGAAWIRIRSHADETTWPDEPVHLLVVDEAHHMTRTGTLSSTATQRVTQLAHEAEALLLLSATPVRSNEAGFLDLLHLLDPEHYQPDQLEDFVRRVELRDHLALTYQALVPDIDEFDLSLYSDFHSLSM